MSGSQKKRSLVSFKDVQIAYLLEGISGIEKLITGKKNPGPLLRRALRELVRTGNKADTLDKYVSEHYGVGSRGRAVPASGQERVYRAQKLESGGAFLRLPLAPLGTKKGDFVRVKFEPNKITVQSE